MEGSRTYTQEQIDVLYDQLKAPGLTAEDRRQLQLQLSHALACIARVDSEADSYGRAVNNNMMPVQGQKSYVETQCCSPMYRIVEQIKRVFLYRPFHSPAVLHCARRILRTGRTRFRKSQT